MARVSLDIILQGRTNGRRPRTAKSSHGADGRGIGSLDSPDCLVRLDSLWDRSRGVGALVYHSDGWEGVGYRRNAGLGIRRWRLDFDRRPGAGTLTETSEGHARRSGPRRVRSVQLYIRILVRTKASSVDSLPHTGPSGTRVRTVFRGQQQPCGLTPQATQ